MKIQMVNARVAIMQKPGAQSAALQVYRTGQDAFPVTEIPILQAQNGLSSVDMVSVVGEIEVNKSDEFLRLQEKYPKTWQLAYPTAGAPMPKTVDDLDHEGVTFLDPNPPKAPAEPVKVEMPAPVVMPPSSKAELRAKLGELLARTGKSVPFGNHSVERLQAMIAEAEAA